MHRGRQVTFEAWHAKTCTKGRCTNAEFLWQWKYEELTAYFFNLLARYCLIYWVKQRHAVASRFVTGVEWHRIRARSVRGRFVWLIG